MKTLSIILCCCSNAEGRTYFIHLRLRLLQAALRGDLLWCLGSTHWHVIASRSQSSFRRRPVKYLHQSGTYHFVLALTRNAAAKWRILYMCPSINRRLQSQIEIVSSSIKAKHSFIFNSFSQGQSKESELRKIRFKRYLL